MEQGQQASRKSKAVSSPEMAVATEWWPQTVTHLSGHVALSMLLRAILHIFVSAGADVMTRPLEETS